jgi:hypothetical protein
MTDTATPLETSTEVVAYRVCCVPMDYPEWYHWAITVEWRAPDKWSVTNGQFEYSRKDARRAYPTGVFRPSNKQPFRFDLQTALDLARTLAPKLTVNGKTAVQYMEWYADRTSAT